MNCKSYTGRANINIYNGDCMEFMRNKTTKYNLAIIDPPYGEKCDINSNGNRTSTKNGYSKLYLEHTSQNWNQAPNMDFFLYLFDISKNQIIWGGNFFELRPSSGWVVWNKMQREFTFGDGELAWTSFTKAVRIYDLPRSAMFSEDRIHITQKPVALYKYLLRNYAKEGDKILDTHGGSMSIAIACWDLGFDLDIIELDKDYYDKAVERFERHINQKQLF
jgi:site-specific DNA-methyltransferase (adenine-specific)